MADTRDLLTLAEGRDAVNARSSADDSKLAGYITGVSYALDHWCGPVIQRTLTDERYDGGSGSILLRYYPITSVSSLTDYSTALTEETDPTSPPAAGYLLSPYSADPGLYGNEVRRRSGGADSTFYAQRGAVLVTYVAGRFAATANVDWRWKEAARICLQNMWRSQQHSIGGVDEYDLPHQSFARFGLPNAARHLIAGELQIDPEKPVVVA